MMQKILKFVARRKFIAVIIILILAVGGWFGYKAFKGNVAEVRYVLAGVEKGTITLSVSGSGTVSVFDQVDIKPKVSGDVIYVGVKQGQEVKAGATLVQIDNREAQKAVRDAQTSLETAKLELEELLQPVDAYSLMQAENGLIQAKDTLTKLKFSQESDYQKALDSKQKAEDDLKKAYEDGFNNVANAFLDLPGVMAGLHDILFSYSFSLTQENINYYADAVKSYDERVIQYKTDAYDKYQIAIREYDENFQDYKTASRFSDTSVIESLIDETYETAKNIAESVKSANNLIQFYQNKLIEWNLKPAALSTTHLSNLNTYTGKANSHLLNLLSIKRTIQTNKETITKAERDLKEMEQNNPLDLAAAERAIKEREESFTELKAGPDELDIRAKKIAIQQKEDALLSAQQNLEDHFIRAPFEGIIAKIDAKKGESVPAIVASLITKQKIAEITLNEIDVAKVKLGQKATLAFDAVSDLNITGEVVEIDAIGAVSQGVVSYNVKITFDAQDERVKPGMSVSANIILDARVNSLVVSNSAVKSQGNTRFVEIAEIDELRTQDATNPAGIVLAQPPRRQSVEIGISNDEFTEIVSGLKEGDLVVINTINSQSSANNANKSQQQNSGLRIPGLSGGGGFR